MLNILKFLVGFFGVVFSVYALVYGIRWIFAFMSCLFKRVGKPMTRRSIGERMEGMETKMNKKMDDWAAKWKNRKMEEKPTATIHY